MSRQEFEERSGTGTAPVIGSDTVAGQRVALLQSADSALAERPNSGFGADRPSSSMTLQTLIDD